MKKKRNELTGNPVRDARIKLRMSQDELAGELDIARTSVVAAEKETPRPWMALACLGLGNLRFMDARVITLSGRRLKQHRERLGLTPVALGEQLGFAESTILTWERGAPPQWVHPAMIGLSVVMAIG